MFTTIIEPIDIFDVDRSDAEIAEIAGTAAQADAIAARVKKVAIEKMENILPDWKTRKDDLNYHIELRS
jgi:hypothetical protein